MAQKKILAIESLKHPKVFLVIKLANNGVDITSTVATSSIFSIRGKSEKHPISTRQTKAIDSLGGGAKRVFCILYM